MNAEVRRLFEESNIEVVEVEGSAPRANSADHPGKLVIQTPEAAAYYATGLIERGGFCYAAYQVVFPNLAFPDSTEGIFAQVVSDQGRGFVADCSAYMPDARRGQYLMKKPFMTLDSALRAVAEWLPEARQRVQNAIEIQEELNAQPHYKVSGPAVSTSSDYAKSRPPTAPAATAPKGFQCPTWTDLEGGDIVGCGSFNTKPRDESGEVYDCRDCGIFFKVDAVHKILASASPRGDHAAHGSRRGYGDRRAHGDQ